MSATKMTGLSTAVLTGGMVLVGPSASAVTAAVPGGTSPTGTNGSTGEISGVQQTSVGHRCGALFAHSHAHGAARAAEVADGGPAATAWWSSLSGTSVATTDLAGRGLHCGLLAKSMTPAPTTPTDDQTVADAPDASKTEADEAQVTEDKSTEDKADSGEADSSNEGDHSRSSNNALSSSHQGWAGHHGSAAHHGRHHRGGAGR